MRASHGKSGDVPCLSSSFPYQCVCRVFFPCDQRLQAMAGSHSSQMAKARVQKAFMYGLLAACAAAGVAVVLVGLYAKIPTQHGGPGGVWEDPNLTYVKTPNLLEIRKAFTPDLCYDSYDLQWKSGADGQIYVNGNPFFMKGKLIYGAFCSAV